MVIQCSHCQARFKMADEKIKPGGTKVRCAKCREIFTVIQETATAQTPLASIPDKTNPPQIPQNDEFSFDVGDIEAPALAPTVDNSNLSASDQNTEGDAFSFDSSETEGDAFSFNEPAGAVITVKTETTASPAAEFGDDSAFTFDEAPSVSLPVQTSTAPQSSDGDAFGFGETEEEVKPFDIKAPVAPQTEAFSFDSDSDATGFGEFSFDEKPRENTAQIDHFSFEQSGAGSDFSWDEPPASASLESKPSSTATPQSHDAHEEIDFGNISFGDESAAPTIMAPSQTAVAAPQKNLDTAEIGITAATAPVAAATRLPQEPSLTKKPQKVAANKAARSRQKPKSTAFFSTIFKLLLVILILGGGVLGYLYRDKVQSGYRDLINRFIEQQAPKEDQGQIDLINVYESEVENSQEGTLYVIRGEAVNRYNGLRSSILVKAVLHGATGKVLLEQSAYCGNVMNDKILSKSTLTEIKGFMANELGDSLTNLNIEAGKTVPFTIVFKAEPKDITKSTVEVVDSKPGIK